MTPAQLDTLATDIQATAASITCPRCGTGNARCRVWAGGPGHTSGMHDARTTLAQHTLTQKLHDDIVDELTPP